jgi:hypothetical protein
MRSAVALLIAVPLLAHADPLPDAGARPDAGAPKTVAFFTLAREQVEHPKPGLPDWFKNAFANETVSAVYKVCLGKDGHVTGVTPIKKLGYVDDELIKKIQLGWTYKPQAAPVCFVATIRFQINGSPPHYRLPDRFDGHILAMPQPTLAASVAKPIDAVYQVCFSTDGSVVDVRRIAGRAFDDGNVRAQIRATWRLDPQPRATCMAAPLRW